MMMTPEIPFFSAGKPFPELSFPSDLQGGKRKRTLAAIMFADMVGFTRLMNEDEKATIVLSEKLRSTLDKMVVKYRGQMFQYTGDGCLSVFRSAIDAVRSAIAIQQKLQQDPSVPVRIGIHLGEVMFYGQGIYGTSVNIASRIESFGTPGSVLISEKVNRELTNQSTIRTYSLGRFELKNVDRDVEIYAVSASGLCQPDISEMKGKGQLIEHRIGVLPFRTAADAPSQSFADGLTEELLHCFADVRGLQVASRTACFSYKNYEGSISKIADELGVSLLLEGSVRRDEDLARVTVQLIDGTNGFQCWSDSFNFRVRKQFEAQEQMAQQITAHVSGWIGAAQPASFRQQAAASNGHAQAGPFLERIVRFFQRGIYQNAEEP